ncbi:MAG: echA8 5 [Actinomycetia bacterium]|nr:echA8 5 [Actinomycetes bacterium]
MWPVTEHELGTPHLRLERDGPIAWCTIDRPAKRNAFTPAMYYGIKRAVRLVNTDPDLGALVITGVDDVFAPGGDLGGTVEAGEEPVPPAVGNDILPFLAVRDSRAPVISAVNGLCQGGGLLIAMLSDVAVASDRSTFRAPELLRGIPDAFYAAVLPAHVGIAVARDLLLTGRVLDATEARTLGLLSRVVPHDELRAAALDAAHQVLRTAPDARMHVKRMLNERYGAIDTQTMSWSLETSAELREGMVAFMEKRPPSWIPEGVDP